METMNKSVNTIKYTKDNAHHFKCRIKLGNRTEEWDGYVKKISDYGSHYEIHVQSRSGIVFMVGDYINGRFISVPAYGVGCDLGHYDDYFWNHESLSRYMNIIDSATICQALYSLYQSQIIQ
ncbi:MAG TPA: hypothetical protein PKK61_13360 [Defluviitaleaceae bacterium]|nr:hypothetical protein [Defluviitaleaceae bacterium]